MPPSVKISQLLAGCDRIRKKKNKIINRTDNHWCTRSGRRGGRHRRRVEGRRGVRRPHRHVFVVGRRAVGGRSALRTAADALVVVGAGVGVEDAAGAGQRPRRQTVRILAAQVAVGARLAIPTRAKLISSILAALSWTKYLRDSIPVTISISEH